VGSIQEISTGRQLWLEPEHSVGRAVSCALRLDPSHVSAQHAVLRWTGECWEVKDLGSRNGTFVDGVRLGPGEERKLSAGATLAFGHTGERWELRDDSPPSVMAVPLDGGEAVLMVNDLLALPSTDDPRATIYRSNDGQWMLELPDQSTTILDNRQTFEVEGRSWRFCSTESEGRTSLAASSLQTEVRYLTLTFTVSRDEEYVKLEASWSGKTFDVGARVHNYLLLTLARRRLKDAGDGVPDGTSGWIDQEDLAHDRSMAPPHLNISVFRIRRQFAALGVIDAANIVERRPSTRSLRIGTGRIAVVRV